jgi:hypothetical protein
MHYIISNEAFKTSLRRQSLKQAAGAPCMDCFTQFAMTNMKFATTEKEFAMTERKKYNRNL